MGLDHSCEETRTISLGGLYYNGSEYCYDYILEYQVDKMLEKRQFHAMSSSPLNICSICYRINIYRHNIVLIVIRIFFCVLDLIRLIIFIGLDGNLSFLNLSSLLSNSYIY